MKITTREQFAQFLEELKTDLENNPQEWENRNLPDFLEAMSRYVMDIQQYYINTKQNINADQPDWGVFADIFRGAKVYE